MYRLFVEYNVEEAEKKIKGGRDKLDSILDEIVASFDKTDHLGSGYFAEDDTRDREYKMKEMKDVCIVFVLLMGFAKDKKIKSLSIKVSQ